MMFDLRKLIIKINHYMAADRLALFEIVREYYPYDKDGEYNGIIGLAHMNAHGFDTLEGEELKGRIEAFDTVLNLIDRMVKGEDI